MTTWDRHAIKAEIHRRGETLTGLAIKAGVEPAACRTALIRSYRQGEIVISEFLGIPRHVLWPDRYRADSGTTRRRRARRARSRSRTPRKQTRASNRRKAA